MENPDNPYKEWTMVFLPYCTGDVFLAAKDTTYQNPNPTNDFPLPFFTIHHRGFDNFLYVMDYVRNNLLDPNKDLNKVVVAGSSAGSYGAIFNFPWVKEMLGLADNPKAKAFLISDGGAGVITGPFLDDALFGDNSSWYIDANLHQDLLSLTDVNVVTTGTDLIPEAYRLNSGNNPKDKFAQYTTAYDAVQVFFWSIMPDSSGLDFAGWNLAMDTITGGLSDELSNYRRYVDPGCDHTIFRFPEFYTSSFEGEHNSFLDWITGMTVETNAVKADWQNLSCTPGVDCGEDSLTPEGIGACLARTFGS